ncbi:dehydrodolichyl diphosphate synthase complex subunit DHDDS [Nymphalis io]|uniref:dehydrodolichyl diphosphate synthase complex subunit DHDDS n=1 Tax=Inachis io TaxID=171585 RepID=UPI00216959FB|nr:dehydrodolichyl diphosphate synthase complex subunit DHDDS [Nymphalis io]XP_050362930.1 dehydrodolichyl diphosphate synthase complex subunit DHDDS [Nymphalis io]
MATWIKQNCISFFQLFCIKVIKNGRIPQHLAFIMDGNRRYAKKLSVDSSAGHVKGFDKLSETLKWCLDLGIPEVTVYAFSIENYKRSNEEVDALMDLARDKFKSFLDEIDQINEWGVKLHIAGRLSLLPNDLQVIFSKAMLATKNNNKLRLNIAYSYTGRDEISRAASHIVDSVQNNDLSPDDIDEDLITQTLDLGAPELLVRTSGEVRLSDFMLWQVSNTVLYFTDVLWPEFTIWNLLAAIIHFQRHAPPLPEEKESSPIQQEFLRKLETKRWQELEKIISF